MSPHRRHPELIRQRTQKLDPPRQVAASLLNGPRQSDIPEISPNTAERDLTAGNPFLRPSSSTVDPISAH
ncbi:hypothetical protein HPP92_006928 [Vanilla planifolia]|uniref:Uncharacterized protein n=1 Tax=Vanilla planifolia TaxID=51239 RepID=A0A835RLV1_VANPL|nr:hypothetical protein HPP92_007168 [Vanilla planifolia]KAG0490065.1 hypothetical protein HPP92_006928 [Vanilla planifolia]